ncbi:MAG TPA: hypothetical protein VF149_00885, partial [Bacillales bacterium]
QKTIKKLAKVLSKPIWYLGCYDILPEKTIGQKFKKARLHHALTLSDAANIWVLMIEALETGKRTQESLSPII